ncbi:MAG TPA: glycogen debranching protein GlgX [Thermomicrobiales bacterium]|nr:glycogen debranching protein GlgX [Thermomicrobiales bacterium]
MPEEQPSVRVRPGKSYPLGATWDGNGVNFALYSANAHRVDVCLYSEDSSSEPSEVITLPECTNQIWHGFVPDVQPGTLYGFRVHGTFDPQRGLRFNASKLLLDPYAKAIHGEVKWDPSVYAYDFDDPDDDLSLSDEPDDQWLPKSVVIDPTFDWEDDKHPEHRWTDTIIYEVHVKGFTKQFPDMPAELRGTYRGLAHPSAIKHLTDLGVTAVELLPVHAFVDDEFLVQKGLRNYWGYSTLGYFAPEGRYAQSTTGGEQVREFKEMVKALHAANIEVILDVVFNHSCEGNHLGPMLSFRGIDNTTYYRLLPDKPRYYMDLTGTGNTMNLAHHQVLKLVTDSLRYWVTEMHVDGFRFDLASTLGREHFDFDPHGGFFDAIHQDPLLSQVKLIAEPWDVGEGGYQVGNFPILWSEWNDRFRDGVRTFWQTQDGGLADIGYRLTGSSDLYEGSARGPRAGVNLITTHDGFTLEDLVSYAEKHNEANGEDGQDGHDHNISANYGVEGPTDDPAIRALRARQKRNMMASLIFSQGVPMISGGDEIGRTQQGNNNAYCQDNEINWFDWDLDDDKQDFLAFVQHAIRIRQEHPILRLHRFFRGRPAAPNSFKDLTWFRADGHEMEEEDWDAAGARVLGLRISGNAIEELDDEGYPITTPTLLLLLNAGQEDIEFSMPAVNRGTEIDSWKVLLDTSDPRGHSSDSFNEHKAITLKSRTLILCEGLQGPVN